MYKNYLIIRSCQNINVFGKFTGELLRLEGFANFETVDLDKSPFPEIDNGDFVLLTRCFLKGGEIDRLLKAVKNGAGLVVLQPRPKFATALGLSCRNELEYTCSLSSRYGKIQILTPLQLYSVPENWEVVSRIDNKHSDAAIVSSKLEKGAVSVFFYDLPATVARLRFGDPALANYTSMGFTWEHYFDLAAGQIDETALHLPQADIHSRLMAGEIQKASPHFIPRLWYFEEVKYHTAIAFHSDGDSSVTKEYELLADVLERCGGKTVFYLLTNDFTLHNMPPEEVEEFRRRGHEFGVHVNADRNGPDDLYFAYPEAIKQQSADFEKRYGEKSPTLQAHCAPWLGYLEWAELHEKAGFRLLFAPLGFSKNTRKSWGQYLFGSGRPLKFFDEREGIKDVWQQPTIFFDDASLTEMFADEEFMCRRIDETLENSMKYFFSSFGMLSHPCAFAQYSRKVMEHILNWMHKRQQPIYSGGQWLDYCDRRTAVMMQLDKDAVEIKKLNGKQVILLPENAEDVNIDGRAITGTVKEIASERFMFIQLDSSRDGSNFKIKYSCRQA